MPDALVVTARRQELMDNYRAAYEQANGYPVLGIRFYRGYYYVQTAHGLENSYRASQIADMTARLRERPAKASETTSNVPAPNLLVVRIYREGDPLVSVMQVVMAVGEGLSFASCMGGAIIDAMTDTSGDAYGYVTEPAYGYVTEPAYGCEALATPRLGPLVNTARCIAATHEQVRHP